MSWISDIFQEVPLSAVLRERVALAEQKGTAIEEENRKLREQVTAWKAKCDELQRLMPKAAAAQQFEKRGGLLWLKQADGTFEEAPYCPKCELVMGQFPPRAKENWICGGCNFMLDW